MVKSDFRPGGAAYPNLIWPGWRCNYLDTVSDN